MSIKVYNAAGEEKINEPGFAPQAVIFGVANGSAVSIGTGATKMTWDTKDFDPHQFFDLANDRFQPRIPGYYNLKAQVRFAGNAAGELAWLSIYKNGAIYKYIDAQKYLAASGAVSGSAIVYANGSSDYFEVYAQNSVARSTSADVTTSWFQGELVGASVGNADTRSKRRFYSRQEAAGNHSDGNAGWQNIQGFSDMVVPVTDPNQVFRVKLHIRAISSNSGYGHDVSIGGPWGDDGSGQGLYANINFDGFYHHVSLDVDWKPGSVGNYTLRPKILHAAGSGFLTLYGKMVFSVEDLEVV